MAFERGGHVHIVDRVLDDVGKALHICTYTCLHAIHAYAHMHTCASSIVSSMTSGRLCTYTHAYMHIHMHTCTFVRRVSDEVGKALQ